MVGICRLCAALRRLDSLVTMTDENHDLCHKLRKCFQIMISFEDALPRTVCRDCVTLLLQSFEFYKKVHESQESLAMLFPAKRETLEGSGATTMSTLAQNLASAVFQKTSNDNIILEEEVLLEQQELEDAMKEDEEEEEKHLDVQKFVPESAGAQTNNTNDQIFPVDVEDNLILEKQFEDDIDENLLIENLLKKRYEHLGGTDCNVTPEEAFENNQDDNANTNQEVDFDKHLPLSKLSSPRNEFEVEDMEAETYIDDPTGSDETWSTYPWHCYLCSDMEISITDLLMHCHVSHDLQPADMKFKCIDCQKVCPHYSSFINHVRTRHRSSLSLCCDVCNDHCVDFKQLALHRRMTHIASSEYPNVLLCEECGRGFANQNALQIHIKGHKLKGAVYECKECGNHFTRLYSLKAHQKVHSDVKDFSCEQCGKSFRQKVNLETHMLSHQDDKPYACSLCNKRFKTTGNLEKHGSTHTDEKQFKCDHCDKTFRTKDAKLSHERTHTGEMPYTCNYCSRPFRFRSTFLSHQNIHTGNRPYSCLACDHHFSNWSNYNKHMKRRHGDETKSIPGKIKKRAKKVHYPVDSAKMLDLNEVVEEMPTDSPATVIHDDIVYALSNDSESYDIIEMSSIPETCRDFEKTNDQAAIT